MKKTLVALLILCAATCGAKQLPLGVAVVLPNGNDTVVNNGTLASYACWSDPNIKGVCIREGWGTIESTQGSPDWTYFTAGVELCRQNGKFCILQVDGSHDNAPSWLTGSELFNLNDGIITPTPWNADVQTYWGALMQAIATKWDHQPVVAGITMWLGGTTIECYFANDSAAVAALDAAGGPQVWINGAEALLNCYNYFEATYVYLATGQTVLGDDNNTMDTFATYALGWGGVGWQTCGLNGSYPSLPDFAHTNILDSTLSADGPFMAQVNLPVNDGGDPLSSSLPNAYNNGFTVVQVYPNDPSTDPDEASIITFNTEVGAPATYPAP
jgi:hypothetical protein